MSGPLCNSNGCVTIVPTVAAVYVESAEKGPREKRAPASGQEVHGHAQGQFDLGPCSFERPMPTAEGKVVEIDFENLRFVLLKRSTDAASDSERETVLVRDDTEFVIAPDPIDGSPAPLDGDGDGDGNDTSASKVSLFQNDIFGPTPAGFGDLRVDDKVEVFGQRNDAGQIEADRVVILRPVDDGGGGHSEQAQIEQRCCLISLSRSLQPSSLERARASGCHRYMVL